MGPLSPRPCRFAGIKSAYEKAHAEAGEWGAFGEAGSIEDAAIAYPIQNFYMTDPVSRASATMAKCTEAFVLKNAGDEQGMTGTHG